MRKEEFGELLKAFRKSSGKTIDQVAEELKYSRSYFLQIQSGSAPTPQPAKIAEIATVLGLDKPNTERLLLASFHKKHMLNLDCLPDDLRTKVRETVISHYAR